MAGIGRVWRRKWKNPNGISGLSRFYTIAFSFNGKEIREATEATTEKEAWTALRRRIEEIGRGQFSPGQDRIYLTDLVEMLKADYRNNARRSLDDALLKLKPVLEYFEGTKACQITEAGINKYVDSRLSEGKARATINGELRYIRRLFALAYKAIPQPPRIALLSGENQRDGFIDPADFKTLLSKVEDEDSKDLIEFLYWTGWRVRAGRLLEWNSINDKRSTITMTSALSKNKTPLELPCSSKLSHILDRRRANRRLDCRLVFHREGRPVYLRKHWAKATAAAGFKGLMIHDLCRSFARNVSHAGVNETVASKYMNRKTVAIYKLYRVVDSEDLRQAGNALDNLNTDSFRTVHKVTPEKPLCPRSSVG